MINFLKAAGIRFVDFLDSLRDPYDEFIRPALPADKSKKLHELEAEFYDDLMQNFWVCNGKVLASSIPLSPPGSVDMGDQATYHGILTGMLALRFTQHTDKNVVAEMWNPLSRAILGLKLHQTAHGEAKPRLIRGVSEDEKNWEDDASNDSATGHLFGIWAVHRMGTPDLRQVCHELIRGLADELLDHGHALVRSDGHPTTFGALIQGFILSDPLRVSLCAAIYSLAHTITGDPKYLRAYIEIKSTYREIIGLPKIKLWTLNNNSDTHRAAIHLAILADTAPTEDFTMYARGLSRLRQMVVKDGNVWVNALCRYGVSQYAAQDSVMTLKVLSEFDLKKKRFNDGIDAYKHMTTDLAWVFLKHYGTWPVKWNKTWKANQPLPRHMVMSHDFVWAKDLHSLDVGMEGKKADRRIHAGDFLCAYWLSRKFGIIRHDD